MTPVCKPGYSSPSNQANQNPPRKTPTVVTNLGDIVPDKEDRNSQKSLWFSSEAASKPLEDIDINIATVYANTMNNCTSPKPAKVIPLTEINQKISSGQKDSQKNRKERKRLRDKFNPKSVAYISLFLFCS